jgi:8-oxo-dGTP pyrophosphatase MutT (NUDIX family)
MAAAALFRDGAGRVLLVEPTYRPTWDLPGGAVEAEESPHAACRREVAEELGLDRVPGRVLAVDWVPSRPDRPEGLIIVYDGGILPAADIGKIVLEDGELAGFEFTEPGRVASRVSPLIARVRALGRGTRKLYNDLREGTPATLHGPYGMFDYTLGGQRQIWIAGGIGIAPFLGWLTSPTSPPPRTDLFYSAPDSGDAPFAPELATAAKRQSGLRFHPYFSRKRGRLTGGKIQDAVGPLTPDTHVFLCGPARMVANLSRDLHQRGIPRDHIHSEHFAFR